MNKYINEERKKQTNKQTKEIMKFLRRMSCLC